MNKIVILSLTCGVLTLFAPRTTAAPGDWQDQFEQATLQAPWQSAVSMWGTAYPADWSLDSGILRGHWTHFGQQHLTVAGPTNRCTIQVRCRLDRAGQADSTAGLILRAEDPAIQHPGIGAANYFGLGIADGQFIFGRVFATTYDFPKTAARPGLQVGTWHTLKAEINGAHIRCFLDGETVFETDDTSFTGHHYGVAAIMNADVSFDDFQIAALPVELPAATSRAVGTGQLIDTGWPIGTGSQEKVTFMIVADPASTNSTNPAPAQATVVMDSPAIQKLLGKSLVLQGAPEDYVESGHFTQDPKGDKEIHFKTDDKWFTVGFNDNSFPGNHPDPGLADWVGLVVTEAPSGNTLLSIYGPLCSGDVMDYVPMTTQPEAPTLNVSKMMRVSWPYTLAQFALEGTVTVDGNWQPVDAWIIAQGGEHQVFLPITSPMNYFRLVETK